MELNELAIKELFQELKLTPTLSTVGKLIHYQAKNIELFVGDFFDLSTEILGKVDASYDRASLVALPLDTRKDYSKHLIKITRSAPQLLVCLEYDQSAMNGPPFSITANEVHQHYQEIYSLDCVEKNEIVGGLKQRVAATESTWILHSLD